MWNDPKGGFSFCGENPQIAGWTNQRPRVCPVEPTDYSDARPGLGTPQPNRPTGTLRHSQVTMFATALTSKLAAPTALKASVRARYESHPSPATDPRASPETPDRALD